MGDIVYQHNLLDLEVKEVRKIIHNTFAFTTGFLEKHIPELIDEIQVKAGNVLILEETIEAAVEAVDDFIEELEDWFDSRIVDDDKWKRTRSKAKQYYLKVLNKKGALVFAHETEGRTIVINKPLFHAIGETCIRIFDYSISKSDQMRDLLIVSDDHYREKMFRVKRSTSLKYYFIKVLREYGATDSQLIKNIDTVFGGNIKKAINATNNLPPLYR